MDLCRYSRMDIIARDAVIIMGIKTMKDIHLNLKGEYFDQIKAGTKEFEYREMTDYWVKRLDGKEFNQIIIKRGYPKKDDKKNIITRPWLGYIKQAMRHKQFGIYLVNVYAIKVN